MLNVKTFCYKECGRRDEQNRQCSYKQELWELHESFGGCDDGFTTSSILTSVDSSRWCSTDCPEWRLIVISAGDDKGNTRLSSSSSGGSSASEVDVVSVVVIMRWAKRSMSGLIPSDDPILRVKSLCFLNSTSMVECILMLGKESKMRWGGASASHLQDTSEKDDPVGQLNRWRHKHWQLSWIQILSGLFLQSSAFEGSLHKHRHSSGR